MPSTYWRNCQRPERPQDWVLLSLAILAVIPFLFANAVIFIYRKRKYFRAEGVDLILGSSTAGLVWIASSFVVNQHFKRERHSLLSICSLWTFWLQMSLGFCLWLSCLAVRLHRLYILGATDEPPSTVRGWIFIPLLLVPSFVFSLVATVYRVSHYVEKDDIFKCEVHKKNWKVACYLLIPPLYFSAILILGLRLRGQRDLLLGNEYRHTSEYASMAFVIYLLTGAIYWSAREDNVYGRCFLTFCVCSLVFFHFWVRMGWPVYLCLFKPKSQMDRYEECLRRKGANCLDKLQKIASLRSHGSPGPATSYHFSVEDGFQGISEAISTAEADIAHYKTQVQHLEQQKESITGRIKHLKDQLLCPSHSSPNRLSNTGEEMGVEMHRSTNQFIAEIKCS